MRIIRALLTDLDGVIRIWDDDHERRIEQDFGLPQQTLRTIAFVPAILTPVITGHVADEEWRKQIEQRLAEQFPGCDAAAVTQQWSAHAGRVDQQMLALVRQCRKQLPVALVTNATSRLSRDLDRLQLSGEFDTIVNSAEIGAAKPKQQIFQFALDALGVQAAEALFIDDSPGHVHAARALGIIGHVHRDRADTQQLLRTYRLC